MNHLTRTYTFDGLRAEFSYSADIGFQVRWLPDVPQFTNKNSYKAFLTKYLPVRKAFLTEVAASSGKSVLVVDGDGRTEVF